MSACYPYDVVSTPVGSIPRPDIVFTVQGPAETLTLQGMFDSGSDIILLPLSVGQALGFNPSAQTSTYGVSGSASGQIFNNVPITFAGQTFRAPVFVSVGDDAPILLGRAGVWTQFDSFTFYNAQNQMCVGAAEPEPIQFTPPYWQFAIAAAAGAFAAWLILR